MNDDTGVPAAVFALKPEWADLILSGAKTVEIRRGRMKRMIGRMLIYRTGTGLIVGEVRVKGMHAAPPETIWRGYGTESRIPKNLFDEYAKGADRLYAYRLENPIRYGKPKTLSDIGLKRAPQSWCYLPETGPRIQLVSATAGFGSACFDCSLAISSSHTSLGVLYPRSFMGVSLISPTIASSSSCVRSSKLVPLGR